MYLISQIVSLCGDKKNHRDYPGSPSCDRSSLSAIPNRLSSAERYGIGKPGAEQRLSYVEGAVLKTAKAYLSISGKIIDCAVEGDLVHTQRRRKSLSFDLSHPYRSPK